MAYLDRRQSLIEQNRELKPIAGRKRKVRPAKSSEILSDCYIFLQESLTKIVLKIDQYKTRKDALLTVSTRAIKDLTQHLLKYTTMNSYKSAKAEEYSISFLEAFHALYVATDMDKEPFFDSFLEFCTLTYPEPKVETLINCLMKENEDLFDSLTAKLKLLKNRKDISKTAFICRAKRSKVFHTLVRLSQNVLQRMMQESEFGNNPNVAYLLNTFNLVLSSE